MSEKFTGIAASNGIGIAKAYLLVEPDLSISYNKKISNVNEEVQRVNDALDASKSDLEKIKEKAIENLGAEDAAVFDAHIEILSDPELIAGIQKEINTKHINAESAVKDVTDMYIATFEAMTDNAYMQERAADIRDITKRINAHLLGIELPSPALIDEEVVVVAHDLTPSDTAQLDPKFVKGIVTDLGGRTAHAAILARSLEIPAIVGSKIATSKIKQDQLVVIDGTNGNVIVTPTKEEVDDYTTQLKKYADQKIEQAKLKNADSISKDGVKFVVGANIGSPKDMEAVLNNGAEGIGLYRTEFLFLDSDHLPTEEEQFQAYKTVLEKMGNKVTTVRTMDIGGDKQLSYWKLPQEENPFLGYRAIRISLKQTDIFKTQLRALLRASIYGNLWIMFPMIATLPEFRAAKKIYDEVYQELQNENIHVSSQIKVGIMIEVPAAAVLADQFAKEVDFFSIGTNDLIQYTMAADRGNDSVSYLYQPYNPSILRLIKNVIDSAHKEGKFAAMCGEMAGDPIAVPILMGMGLDEFSMSASSILPTRSMMAHLSVNDMKKLAEDALNSETNEEVIKIVESKIN
ncbi:MAG: phosphoenolpyruvate--protein phosphotransferase [Lactobacillaceae bacterium]|jgi:phosphotransferase system enzyme I (PtsI)|nr:phosphoenolpyruvate--protein phosphotransferase [Lactobacillaceae bacterium]